MGTNRVSQAGHASLDGMDRERWSESPFWEADEAVLPGRNADGP